MAGPPARRCHPEGPSRTLIATNARGPEGSCRIAHEPGDTDGRRRAGSRREADVQHGSKDPSVAPEDVQGRDCTAPPQEDKGRRRYGRSRIEAVAVLPLPREAGAGGRGGPSARGREPAGVHTLQFSLLREERAGRGRERGGLLPPRSIPIPRPPNAEGRPGRSRGSIRTGLYSSPRRRKKGNNRDLRRGAVTENRMYSTWSPTCRTTKYTAVGTGRPCRSFPSQYACFRPGSV